VAKAIRRMRIGAGNSGQEPSRPVWIRVRHTRDLNIAATAGVLDLKNSATESTRWRSERKGWALGAVTVLSSLFDAIEVLF
jgi:hypothetical protein